MQIKICFFGLFLFMLFFIACKQKDPKNTSNQTAGMDISAAKKEISGMLDSFNLAAANANYTQYFNYYAEDATFNGTDATENWDKKSFMIWARPFFNKKTTWNFTSIKRNIYFGKYEDIAWFEELLSTQMKICRGSGVVVKNEGRWIVQQYVLSATIPNDQLDSVIKMKTVVEDSIILKLSVKP